LPQRAHQKTIRQQGDSKAKSTIQRGCLAYCMTNKS
jgi:hypothetical protein